MKRIDWRIFLVSLAIFIIPPLAVPARGVLTDELTSYAYGFPFSWITVSFDSRGGKAFLVQVLFERHQGISVSILGAILNIVILYIAINAIVTVFWIKRRRDSKPKDPPAAPPPEERETVNAGQSNESNGQ